MLVCSRYKSTAREVGGSPDARVRDRVLSPSVQVAAPVERPSKELELPLFPGYLFVHIALRNRLQVLRIPGVSQLIGPNGKPSSLPEHEIQALRNGLAKGIYAEAHSWLQIGRRVRVMRGPLAGAHGILIRKKHNCRIVISVDVIMRSVALEIDEFDVQPVS